MNKAKLFATEFGHFSADGREFIVTTPRTPRPWVNVISNGDAGFILSQTGGGYSWRGNGQLNRLTRSVRVSAPSKTEISGTGISA